MLHFTNSVTKGRELLDDQVYYQAVFEERTANVFSSFPITLTANGWANFGRALQHASPFKIKTKFTKVIITHSREITIFCAIESPRFDNAENREKKNWFICYHGRLNEEIRVSLRLATVSVSQM